MGIHGPTCALVIKHIRRGTGDEGSTCDPCKLPYSLNASFPTRIFGGSRMRAKRAERAHASLAKPHYKPHTVPPLTFIHSSGRT